MVIAIEIGIAIRQHNASGLRAEATALENNSCKITFHSGIFLVEPFAGSAFTDCGGDMVSTVVDEA